MRSFPNEPPSVLLPGLPDKPTQQRQREHRRQQPWRITPPNKLARKRPHQAERQKIACPLASSHITAVRLGGGASRMRTFSVQRDEPLFDCQAIKDHGLSTTLPTVVRRATDADWGDITRIFTTVVSTAQWLPEAARAETDFAAASEGEEIWVAERPGVGVCGFISVWRPESFIHHLYIDPRFHRQGIGTALLESLANWLPEPWTLKCAAANTLAFAFYTARGWKQIETGVSENGPYFLLAHQH